MTVLIIGGAWPLGYSVARRLLAADEAVVDLDKSVSWCDVRLKHARLNLLQTYPQFRFVPRRYCRSTRHGTSVWPQVTRQHRALGRLGLGALFGPATTS